MPMPFLNKSLPTSEILFTTGILYNLYLNTSRFDKFKQRYMLIFQGVQLKTNEESVKISVKIIRKSKRISLLPFEILNRAQRGSI